MRTKRWTDVTLISAVASSTSMAGVLRALGLRPAGGNYANVRLHAERLGLDTNHFLGQAHLRGGSHTWTQAIPLKKVLVANSTYTNTVRLKARLLKAGLLGYECACCGLTEWQKKELVLHLDHVNGNGRDHRLGNLRLLCPNCHSQTDTYCGKKNLRRVPKSCPDCGVPIAHRSTRCVQCAPKFCHGAA